MDVLLPGLFMQTFSSALTKADFTVLGLMRSLLIPAPSLVPETIASPYARNERDALRGLLHAIDAGARRHFHFRLGSALAPTADERAVLSLLADAQAACERIDNTASQNLVRRAEWLVRHSSVAVVTQQAREAGAQLQESGITLSASCGQQNKVMPSHLSDASRCALRVVATAATA